MAVKTSRHKLPIRQGTHTPSHLPRPLKPTVQRPKAISRHPDWLLRRAGEHIQELNRLQRLPPREATRSVTASGANNPTFRPDALAMLDPDDPEDRKVIDAFLSKFNNAPQAMAWKAKVQAATLTREKNCKPKP